MINFDETRFEDENQITIEEGSSKAFVWKNNSSSEKEIYVKRNASLVLLVMNLGEKEKSFSFNLTLDENAQVKVYNVATTSFNATLNEKIYIKQKGATCEILNVSLMSKDATLNSNIEVFHQAPMTESNLDNYAIACDESQLLLNNNGTIDALAAGSICHQKAKGLTLSKKAKIKAMPNLFINEYDVIANHACAIGSINEDDLFYLMSRGLSREEASKLIVMGFVAPLIAKVENEDLQKEIYQKFNESLSY
jgi:Fe-S cluster assembly protein SufD